MLQEFSMVPHFLHILHTNWQPSAGLSSARKYFACTRTVLRVEQPSSCLLACFLPFRHFTLNINNIALQSTMLGCHLKQTPGSWMWATLAGCQIPFWQGILMSVLQQSWERLSGLQWLHHGSWSVIELWCYNVSLQQQSVLVILNLMQQKGKTVLELVFPQQRIYFLCLRKVVNLFICLNFIYNSMQCANCCCFEMKGFFLFPLSIFSVCNDKTMLKMTLLMTVQRCFLDCILPSCRNRRVHL